MKPIPIRPTKIVLCNYDFNVLADPFLNNSDAFEVTFLNVFMRSAAIVPCTFNFSMLTKASVISPTAFFTEIMVPSDFKW